MSESLFDVSKIKFDTVPANWIPSGAVIIEGWDRSVGKDENCTVKGFFDPQTGEYHIQEIVHSARNPT